jgi:Putative metallopeptidase
MKRIGTAALAAASALAVAQVEARTAGISAKLRPDRIDIAYVEPKSAANQPAYKLLKEHRVLEKIRELLRPLRLPHRLLLQTTDCDGISNAWSNEENVTVCYEYINDIWRNAPEHTTPSGVAPIDAMIGPLLDVFLHEAGHATFRSLQIPLFGRNEDAADQFSTYLMLRFDKEEARRLILGSAYQYKGDLASPTLTVKQQNFADEHGTPAQRFFNLLCTAYGSDPKLFADVVREGFLPEDRAVGCEREYLQLSHAFENLDKAPYRWTARAQTAQALAPSGRDQAGGMAERGLIPGWRHSGVALLVVATDEEMMVTQHATSLPRAHRRGRQQAQEWLDDVDS